MYKELAVSVLDGHEKFELNCTTMWVVVKIMVPFWVAYLEGRGTY